jgi:hypothetical protein
MPPARRPENAFDPGAKLHIADNTPYARGRDLLQRVIQSLPLHQMAGEAVY